MRYENAFVLAHAHLLVSDVLLILYALVLAWERARLAVHSCEYVSLLVENRAL